MKKLLFWGLAVLASLVVLLVAAVVVVTTVIDPDSYLPKIEAKVTEATGREVSFGKDADISFFPWVGVAFSDLKMNNPQQFGGGTFVSVDSFEARVKLLPLLSKSVEVKKFVLNGPEIRLVKLADGQGNWTLGEKTAAEPSSKTPAPPTPAEEKEQSDAPPSGPSLAELKIEEFAITNGRLVYEDRATGQTQEVDDISLSLRDVSLVRPVGLEFSAQVNGNPVRLSGSLGPIGQDPGRGEVKVDLDMEAFGQLAAKLSGKVVDPATKAKFDMNLQVDPFSPRELLSSLDMPMPLKTADQKTFTKTAVDINVQGDPTAIEIKDSTITLDESNLQMSARLSEMAKPNVAFTLSLDRLDIDRYLPPPAEKKQRAATTEGTSADGGKSGAKSSSPEKKEVPKASTGSGGAPEAIDYGPLRRLVLDGEFRAGELVAHGAKVENVHLKITGNNGIFKLDPATIDLYQGAASVVGNVNVQKAHPMGKLDLGVKGVEVGPLLKDAAEKDVLRGTMNGDSVISFAGDTPEQIKKSLNGSGSWTFSDGAIVGIDIAEMGRSFAAGVGYEKPATKPTTDFAEFRLPFKLTDGVFRTDDTFLRSPLLRVKAFGSADLVSEKLDMRVRPKIVGTLKGQGDEEKRSGLTVPILVEGTFSKPKFKADMSALANEETVREAIKDPESVKKKAKELEETGKSLLKGLGFGD